MRTHRPGSTHRLKKRLIGLVAAALLLPALTAVTGTTTANAAPRGGYEEAWVDSTMGPIKVQIQWGGARG